MANKLASGRGGQPASRMSRPGGRANEQIHIVERPMIIANAELAVVDIRKLSDYRLNASHVEGKHKARLFAAALGMTRDDAEDLRELLLEAVKTCDARLGRRDRYGQRYTVDFQIEWQGRQALIRSGWIIELGSDIPRLTSCYPL